MILGQKYSEAIDMWSFGCIIFELRFGKPPFKGNSDKDQLYAIFEYTGLPDKEMVVKSKRAEIFFEMKSENVKLRGTSNPRVPGSKSIRDYIEEQVLSPEYMKIPK